MAGRAPRSPAALLRKVRETAAAGWPAGLFLLAGNDAYHLDAAQRAILESLVPEDAGDYALTVFGDEKVSSGTVVAACRSRGMFSSRRVVLVRDLAAIDGEPEPLLDYAERPAPESHLLVRAPGLDRRKKLDKALAGGNRLLLFQASEDPFAAVGEIAELGKQRGLRLSRDAASLLAMICGGDLYRADAELAKLAAWAGGERRTIEVEDVREVAAGEGMMSGWELADAVLVRDRRAALAAARRLIEAGDEPLRIVGGIAWRARVMLTAKAAAEAGQSRKQILAAARAWSYERELLAGLRAYELDELLAFPSHLLEADRELKGGQQPPAVVLESLVDRLVGTARTEGARRA